MNEWVLQPLRHEQTRRNVALPLRDGVPSLAPIVDKVTPVVPFSLASTTALKAAQWYGGGASPTTAAVFAGSTALPSASCSLARAWVADLVRRGARG